MKLVTAQEMRDIELRAKEHGLSLEALIENAGQAVSETVVAESAKPDRVLVLVGPGNNGSDGLVGARNLAAAGREVTVYVFKRGAEHGYEGKLVAAESDTEMYQLRALLGSATVVIDALLGTGQSRPVEGMLAQIVREANQSRGRDSLAIAVDVPTGINSDTGVVQGEPFKADITVCMGFAKRGVALHPGAEYAGAVVVRSVGIPRELARDIPISVPEIGEIAEILPKRAQDGNKGASGRLLMVSGSQDFVGAPSLCAMAAYRAGAGLVEMIIPRPIQPMVAAHVQEVVYLPAEAAEGTMGPEAVTQIDEGLKRARAAVYGPGLALNERTVALTHGYLEALAKSSLPSVLDADGLNALSRLDEWWRTSATLILTPHPGEMSRLTQLPIPAVQADRIGVALRFAQKWQKIVVLKGAGTVTASPDGRAAVNPTGGPNLATAGTGDVLSGIIGGLLAQGTEPSAAAVAGVYLHGLAGDLLRERQGDVGTVAGDLISSIPLARQKILEEAATEL